MREKPLSPDLVLLGSQEAAEHLGLTRDAFNMRWVRTRQEVSEHPLPEPFWQLACGPIWTQEQLDEWKADSEGEG